MSIPISRCVTELFTFDSAFFEEECLTRFAGVESDPSDNDRIYVIEREEKFAQCFAAVIVDQAHAPMYRSLRWQVLVARVSHGIQHAKLSLLVWRKRIRVLIGSANLTEPGYRRNYENVAAFEFGPAENDTPREMLDQVLAFVEDLRKLAAGAASSQGPQAGLMRFLQGVKNQIRGWPRPLWERGEPRAVLLPILRGRSSLFAQLGELVTGSPYDRAWIQSPFFDDGEGAKRVVAQLVSLLAQRGDRMLSFIVPGSRLPSGLVEIGAPEVLRTPFLKRVEHSFSIVVDREVDDLRSLHAKSLWLERSDAAIYCLGSSNFTCAGTGLAGKERGNYELNVAYVLPDSGADFARVCEETYPPRDEVDLETDDVRFLLEVRDRTTDGGELVGLPEAFGEATYEPGSTPMVTCEIWPEAPISFVIADPDKSALLEGGAWRKQGSPLSIKLAWTCTRQPSHLRVTWKREGGEEALSIWPVNVSDPSSLPPPEELRGLSLDELLQILTSAAPPHQTMARILERRSEGSVASVADLDPHRRVDTRGFLLQRMRRFSTALEGMRERLERPVYSREALSWRLSGPFGIAALATRLVEEEKEGAAFMITELAMMMASVEIPASGELSVNDVNAALATSIEDLRALATTISAPPNLANYVTRTFAEIDQ